jgi:hypothetical protein
VGEVVDPPEGASLEVRRRYQ